MAHPKPAQGHLNTSGITPKPTPATSPVNVTFSIFVPSPKPAAAGYVTMPLLAAAHQQAQIDAVTNKVYSNRIPDINVAATIGLYPFI